VRSITSRERASGYARRWWLGSSRIMGVGAHVTPARKRVQRARCFLTPESGGRYSRSTCPGAPPAGRAMQSSPQRIELCGVVVDVEREPAALRQSLEGLSGGVQAAHGTPDIQVRVRWNEGPRETARPEVLFPDWPVDTMIDRHVHVGPNRVVCVRLDDAAAL